MSFRTPRTGAAVLPREPYARAARAQPSVQTFFRKRNTGTGSCCARARVSSGGTSAQTTSRILDRQRDALQSACAGASAEKTASERISGSAHKT